MSEYQRSAYQHIVESGEAALARLSASNRMRPIIERNVADARAKLAEMSA